MSTQKFQKDDINEVTRDEKRDDSSEEHLYEETVFETSKKLKTKEHDQNHDIPSIKREVLNHKNTSIHPVEERKHKTGNISTKNTLSLQESIKRSREIHRQLMNKRNRWKPSELELAILKHNFDKNIYPTKEEKEMIIKSLELKFKSKIDMNQISRWFQFEREKTITLETKNSSKNTYKKFSKEELEYLKKCFSENTYPKTDEMIQIGKKLGVSLSKIENWYKHNRRSLAKKGCFTLKTKKYFKKDEIAYLVKMFELYPRPTKDQVTDMSKKLSCTESQIKNWYSNKRKKQKLIARRRGNSSKSEAALELLNQNNHEFPQNPVPIHQDNTRIPISIQSNLKNSTLIGTQSLNLNGMNELDLKNIHAQAPLKSIPQQLINQNQQQYVPSYQNMPVFIIPGPPINNSSMTINTNTINTNTIYENKIKKPMFEKNHMNQESNPGVKINSIPQNMNQGLNQNLNHNINQNMSQYEISNPRQTTQTNWVSQSQTFPMQSQPYIIVTNKSVPQYGNQSFLISQNGIPMQAAPSIQGIIPYEQPPMQIQYLTSLYAPYSNNNIFSNYYPVVYQSAPPNIQFQQMQPMNGDIQGQMMQQPQVQQIDLKSLSTVKTNGIKNFGGMMRENTTDINNLNKDN